MNEEPSYNDFTSIILASQFEREEKNRQLQELKFKLEHIKKQINTKIKLFGNEFIVEMYRFNQFYMEKYDEILNLRTHLAFLNRMLDNPDSTIQDEADCRKSAEAEVQDEIDEKYRQSKGLISTRRRWKK